MGLLFPKKNELFMTHLAGIDQYHEGWALSLMLTDTEIVFTPRAFKNQSTIHLPIEKITSAKNELFQSEKDESAIARAIVGDLLFGTKGAIVGAMTAGKKKVTKCMYVIRYESNGQQKAIVLSQQQGGSSGFTKWNIALNAELKPESQPAMAVPKDVTL